MNQCQIMGRLTGEPELRQTPNGVPVASFTLAVERRFQRDTVDFIEVVAWRNTAEFCSKYFSKGMRVAVSGSIQTRSYEDKNGNKRKAVEVVADAVYFADGKRQEQGSYAPEPAMTEVNDELPF